MPQLTLRNVVKSYGHTRAVDDLSLEVREGELLTLLGPSGCGKTTTLRAVSGFVGLDGGHIFIGPREVTDIPPERRGIGLVFQNYALWPHMTVFQNLAFGLQLKRLPGSAIRPRPLPSQRPHPARIRRVSPTTSSASSNGIGGTRFHRKQCSSWAARASACGRRTPAFHIGR